jgi:uncharacterized repeat protein (TIGR01451 family)
MASIMLSAVTALLLLTVPMVRLIVPIPTSRPNTVDSAQVPGCFVPGRLLVVSNLSAGDTTWYREVNASPGDVINFSMTVQNGCPGTATNVVVASILQADVDTELVPRAYVFSDNSGAANDAALVHVLGSRPQAFEYTPGHVYIVSPSCPQGCSGPDSIVT